MMSTSSGEDPPDPAPRVIQLAFKPPYLPKYLPEKLFIPDEQSKETERCCRETYRAVLEERTVNKERSIFRGDLIIGDDGGKVVSRTRKAKGNAFHFMGIQGRNRFVFSPEEALLLCEFGTMEVFLGPEEVIPLPLEHLYTVLLRWISVDFYQVFAHLVRMGYLVKRWKPDNTQIMAVRKPKSRADDFYVYVNPSQDEYQLDEVCRTVREVTGGGGGEVKVASVADGSVTFLSWEEMDLPDAKKKRNRDRFS
eukprot:sb/3468696/